MFCSSCKPVIESFDGEFPSFGDRYCHKEPLTIGCEIYLESQMYQMPSIPPFVKVQCLHELLSLISQIVPSFAA